MRATRLLVSFSACAALLVGCGESTDDAAVSAQTQRMVVPEARALLPADIIDSGVLRVGTDPSLAPLTYIAEDGEITGVDIELTRRIGERLGVRVEFDVVPFTDLIDAVTAGRIDVVASAMFNTAERRNRVDFADYLLGGSQWLSRTGDEIEREDPCGLVVAVIEGSAQATEEIPRRSRECQDRGAAPVTSLPVPSSIAGADAVLVGEADAFVTDAPVAEFVVGRSKDRLALVDATYDESTYGLAIAPNQAGLKDAIDLALRTMIEDGSYQRLVGKWGVNSSSIASVA
jgi:polar amino acid transport system substrate-binding protein